MGLPTDKANRGVPTNPTAYRGVLQVDGVRGWARAARGRRGGEGVGARGSGKGENLSHPKCF